MKYLLWLGDFKAHTVFGPHTALQVLVPKLRTLSLRVPCHVPLNEKHTRPAATCALLSGNKTKAIISSVFVINFVFYVK